MIVSEGSAAAGVRRIEAVTGRGAYDLVARRFRALKQTAAALRSAVDEVPQKVQALMLEVADARKELGALRTQGALSTFSGHLDKIQTVKGAAVLAAEIPSADADALRAMADKFREQHPKQGIAVLISGGGVVAAVTEDLVKRGLKAGDLIGAIGGKGGGRPHLAQGSLPDGSNAAEALSRVAKVVEEKLK